MGSKSGARCKGVGSTHHPRTAGRPLAPEETRTTAADTQLSYTLSAVTITADDPPELPEEKVTIMSPRQTGTVMASLSSRLIRGRSHGMPAYPPAQGGGTVGPVADPAEMINAELFERLVTRLVEDEQVDRSHAERVMRQALVFLKACANNRNILLSPTKAVDVGWHTFILHTADYAELCDRIAGEFIHHNPICTGDIRSGAALARTLEALDATGYRVDMELWTVGDAANCSGSGGGSCHQCHATCYDSP